MQLFLIDGKLIVFLTIMSIQRQDLVKALQPGEPDKRTVVHIKIAIKPS